MPKVSIIILIYNTECYMEHCAHTLFGQTLENIEFIFVNDCTPDNSIKVLESVLEQYPHRKSQVRIINHQTNLGSATARNTGIDSATGDYIIHVDSDDWVETDMAEKLHTAAAEGDYDIVWCDFYMNTLTSKKLVKQNTATDSDGCVSALLSGKMHGSTWNKLVRRTLYANNELRFFDGLDMWEDLAMTIRLFSVTNRVAYLPLALYHYQYNTTSIARSQDPTKIAKRRNATFANVAKVLAFLQKRGLSERYSLDINFFKLQAKHCLLEDSTTVWRTTYPESNGHMLDYSGMSRPTKVALWIALHTHPIVYKLYRKLIITIKGYK